MNFEQLLENAPVDGTHIALVAAAAAFLAVLTVWRAMLERSPVQRRIGALAGRREALKRDLTASKHRAPQVSRSVGFAKRTVEKLKLMRGQTASPRSWFGRGFARTTRSPSICSRSSVCR
jgi:hypothetical protein